MARDCGIDAKTVKEYYQILVDTLPGTMLAPRVESGASTGTKKRAIFEVPRLRSKPSAQRRGDDAE